MFERIGAITTHQMTVAPTIGGLMRRLKVLVIDDHHDFAETLGEILAMFGHEVTVAFSGKEAVRGFHDKAFDIAFLDFNMPHMSGVEAILEIRRETPEANIVLMTAQTDGSVTMQASASGALGVLHKPFAVEHLKDMLRLIAPLVQGETDNHSRNTISA